MAIDLEVFMMQGEVAVNNRVDVKSYTSLHKLVDDMFPPQTYTEQVCRLDSPLSCVYTGLGIQYIRYMTLSFT
jgi:hypothetical protein